MAGATAVCAGRSNIASKARSGSTRPAAVWPTDLRRSSRAENARRPQHARRTLAGPRCVPQLAAGSGETPAGRMFSDRAGGMPRGVPGMREVRHRRPRTSSSRRTLGPAHVAVPGMPTPERTVTVWEAIELVRARAETDEWRPAPHGRTLRSPRRRRDRGPLDRPAACRKLLSAPVATSRITATGWRTRGERRTARESDVNRNGPNGGRLRNAA